MQRYERFLSIIRIMYNKLRMQTVIWKHGINTTRLFLWHYLQVFSYSILGYIKDKLQQMRVRTKLMMLFFCLVFINVLTKHIFSNDEDLYVYAGPDDLKLDETDLSATFVLVIAYARTGSSWFGEILSKANESFYVFEPMQRPIAEGYYLKHLVGFNDNTYRKPTSLLERHEFMVTTLHRIFTCKLSKLHPFSKQILVRHQVRMFGETYQHCKTVDSSLSTDCIRELEQRCLSRSHRIVKTIRVSMELVSEMLELWPNMKVINLVRDPRAITDSRLRGEDFKMSFNTLGHSVDMCTRMYEDIKYDWYIQKKYPGKLKIISYEAFAEFPYAATGYVYDFLNMLFREKTWFWVYNSIRNDTNVKDYYATLRFNSTEVAHRWRHHLDYKTAQEIDFSCVELYKALGFIPLKCEEDLRSDSVPTRQKIDTLEGYL